MEGSSDESSRENEEVGRRKQREQEELMAPLLEPFPSFGLSGQEQEQLRLIGWLFGWREHIIGKSAIGGERPLGTRPVSFCSAIEDFLFFSFRLLPPTIRLLAPTICPAQRCHLQRC